MKKIIFIILIVFTTGCKKNNDPFKDLKLGEINFNKFEKQMIKNGVFSDPNIDTTSFKYYITDGNKNFSTEITPNSDGYKFGKLRDLLINLNGDDSIYTYDGKEFARARGLRLKKDILEIYNLYVKTYGKPDSIITDLNFNSKWWIILKNNLDSTNFPKTAFWNKKNFLLKFYTSYPKLKDTIDTIYGYKGCFIKYEMKKYDKEIGKIKDSIRKSFTPKDLISLDVSNPKWSNLYPKYYLDKDFNFKVNIFITRKGIEEPRTITGVRFDIVITDNFNVELCRIKDATYEGYQSISKDSEGNIIIPYSPLSYSFSYYKIGNKFNDLEKARVYSQNHKIKVYSDIKSIVFDDGEVLYSEN